MSPFWLNVGWKGGTSRVFVSRVTRLCGTVDAKKRNKEDLSPFTSLNLWIRG